MISYNPLWQTMQEKNVTQYTLNTKYKMSKALLQRLRRNESVTLYTIQRLCNILKCDISDIVMITPDDETELTTDIEKEL